MQINFRRPVQAVWVFSKYLLLYPLTRYRRDSFGSRLARAFEVLGITYIKIGQMLSMRYDILSPETCKQLQRLLHNVDPLPLDTVHAILQKEYGKPWHLVFASFDSIPLGSASVSQVHKAVTFEGVAVAVKVKRPKVDGEFLNDIKILRKLSGGTQLFSSFLRRVQARKLVDQFEAWIRQDLDFVAEVVNMKKCKEQYGFGEENLRPDLGKGVFPSPLEHLCTSNIIVMDFIEGIPLSRSEEVAAHPDYDLEKTIITYVTAAVKNWFRTDRKSYLFQGDPHLSNILALPHGDAANIDYGLTSELSYQDARKTKELIIAVYMQDVERTLKVGADITGVSYEKYAPLLRPEIEKYLERTKNEGLGFWFMEYVRILVRNGISFPLYLSTFGRTNLLLDGLVQTCLPDKTTLDLLGDELRREAIREACNNILSADWLRAAYALSEKVKEAPRLIETFIDDPLKAISEIARAVRV